MRTAGLLLLAAACSAEVFFKETFDDTWLGRWVHPKGKKDLGKFEHTAGEWHGDEEISKGIKTAEDARFYAISSKVKPFTNKDKPLVVSFTVKHEQGIDCGGGYIKVLPDFDLAEFDGDSEYFMMFGPDICGGTKKVHLIFHYKGKNLEWKKQPKPMDDKLTHVYTVVVNPDGTYEMSIDGEKKESGTLEEDWAFLEPKEIDDPADTKPAEWVDNAMMADPEDKKPEGYDDIQEKIVDPSAEKPDDWDDEEDGEWEAPTVPNPEYKGPWSAKQIPNPDYKGVWKAKKIANPDYKEDKDLYVAPAPLGAVGIDIWQVKSGSIFDNIIISDSVAEVDTFVKETFKAIQTKEKEMHDSVQATLNAASAKAAEAAGGAAADDAAAGDESEEDFE